MIAGTISWMGKDQTVSTPFMSKARQWELTCTVIWTVNLVLAEDGRYVSQKTLINIIKQYYSCQRISHFFETKVLYLMSRVCCEAKCTTWTFLSVCYKWNTNWSSGFKLRGEYKTGPNFMALLTVSSESALTATGNYLLTARVFHGLAANFGFCACVLYVTRQYTLTRLAQKW